MYKMQWNLRTSLADDYKNLTVGHIPLIRTAKARRLNTEITYENVQPKSLERVQNQCREMEAEGNQKQILNDLCHKFAIIMRGQYTVKKKSHYNIKNSQEKCSLERKLNLSIEE
ncbi:hypothetical protein MTR_5g025825 [Medicago truncatula]|uniref:Uncharacterized protein n=1 Tax=Medicago truncatula TaxID=3880 RepID=A0A072UDW9_MEDTR|nr:hypothetical protein MTR_5g025825 [Medicago truncatula]